jgi:hypothetical protein
MKALCSVCGVEGILQQRGNSQRIQHYEGFKEGKRVYLYHKILLPSYLGKVMVAGPNPAEGSNSAPDSLKGLI